MVDSRAVREYRKLQVLDAQPRESGYNSGILAMENMSELLSDFLHLVEGIGRLIR
jgi:hypothetical protein